MIDELHTSLPQLVPGAPWLLVLVHHPVVDCTTYHLLPLGHVPGVCRACAICSPLPLATFECHLAWV